jgi:succinate dehydrogenase / fumarate reductase flavoprotein subunit
VFGKRAGEFAAKFAKENKLAEVDGDQINRTANEALEPFERSGNSEVEGPYQVQRELQEIMQQDVGIVRREDEMQRALATIENLRQRAARVGVSGHRDFNPGWHTALDLKHLLTVSEAITRAALERRESRGAQFRDDYPEKDDGFAKVSITALRAADGTMEIRRQPLPEMPDYLKQIIEEMK